MIHSSAYGVLSSAFLTFSKYTPFSYVVASENKRVCASRFFFFFFFLIAPSFSFVYVRVCVYVSCAWDIITGPVSGLLVDGSRTIDLS